MPCEGGCTFTSTVAISVDSSGRVTGFSWNASHTSSEDCRADIEDGWGWFRFQRTTDAGVQSIDRESITNADPGGGSGSFSGGGLPPGTTITATATDFTGIDVQIPPGSPEGSSFTSIDLNFSLKTRCYCEGNNNYQELHVRLTFNSGSPANERIRHNGATRSVASVEGGSSEVIYTWTSQEVCNESNTNFPVWQCLKRWKELDRKRQDGTLTEEERRELERKEESLEEQDRDLRRERLVSITQKLWKKGSEKTVAELVHDLEFSKEAMDNPDFRKLIEKLRSDLREFNIGV